MTPTLLALPAPLPVNTMWTGLLIASLSSASPSIQKTGRAVYVPNHPLGIELDSLSLQARLHKDKFGRIIALL